VVEQENSAKAIMIRQSIFKNANLWFEVSFEQSFRKRKTGFFMTISFLDEFVPNSGFLGGRLNLSNFPVSR
jgi:hypothetical protein